MNKTSVLNQFVQEVKAVIELLRKASILLLGLAVVALIAYSVQAVISTFEPAAVRAEGAIYSVTNPELFAANRYVRAFSQSLNPELRIAQRHADLVAQVKTGTWTANPELSAAHRFAEMAAQENAISWISNPELMIAARYAISRITDSAFLVENPEVMVHLQFIAAK